MNKYLVGLLVISLTSCNYVNSSNEESVLKTSFDVFTYYQKKKEELDHIYILKSEVINKNNYEIEELTLRYWKEYTDLIILLQDKLNNDEVKDYFISHLGEEEVNDIISIDVNRIFYNRKYNSINLNDIELLVNEINQKIEDSSPYWSLKVKLEDYVSLINEYISSSKLVNVLSDLYLNNSYYLEEVSKLESYYPILNNDYKDIFKELLSNELYKEKVVEDFKLSQEDISYFLVSETYDDEILDLFRQEVELKNQYLSLSSNKEKEELYLNLVKIRNQISSKLGYSSYLDYVYREVYSRNYTIYDALNLINNIKNNYELKKNYLFYASKKDNSSYYFISEKDLLDNLEFVTNIVPESKDVIKEFKMYGLYNFDYRNNKYNGSYKTSLDYLNDDQFILLNVNGNINDYNTLFHEFGHYLGSELENKSLEGNKFDLDIAEVHSQGLEYLMSNYFSLFLNKEEEEILINNLIFNALWTMYSSSLISDFENYIYTTNDLTLDKMQSKFNKLVVDYIYPYSFGMENNNYLYTNISHIFTSPGYYISYLTSIIPSLELWSNNDLELVKKQYKTILSYGTSNDFTYVLNQVNLTSPFEEESIDKISKKIENIKKAD